MYTPLATGIATILAELPYCIVQASIFVPIVYWMVDFEHSAARFFYYYLMSCCSLTMFTAFGLLLVSLGLSQYCLLNAVHPSYTTIVY